MAKNNDELDLDLIYSKIRKQYHNGLISLYRFLRFLIRNSVLLLILIVAGVVLGLVMENLSKGKFLSTIIVQTNFDSTNYVYNAIEALNGKKKDPYFLRKHGFKPEAHEISKIKIEPIVNILDLTEKTIDENRTFPEYIGVLNIDEDVLSSEIFYNEYRYHKINLNLTHEAADTTIVNILDYLNANPVYDSLRLIYIEEAERKLVNHERSIRDIETVFEAVRDTNQTRNPGQVYFKNTETTNIHFLLEEKRTILEEMQRIRTDLSNYDKTVKVLNKPMLNYDYSFIRDNKKYTLPILFVSLFLIFHLLRSIYFKSKRLASGEEG